MSGPQTIGFRLAPEYLERVDEARATESRGSYVRAVLMNHLDSKSDDTSIEALRALHVEIQKVARRLDSISADVVGRMLKTPQLLPSPAAKPAPAVDVASLANIEKELSRLRLSPAPTPAPAVDPARLANIEKELSKVRRDVANGILQLLVQNQPLTAAQANAWAAKHMPD